MSDTDLDQDATDGGDDLLAAEFVLGGLPAAMQAALARRADHDVDFARRIADWEERLAPMAEGFVPADLPPALKDALDLRLFGQAPRRQGLWASLALWRGCAAIATAAFLVAVALPLLQPRALPPDRLAAALTAQDSGVTYLVLYDSASQSVSLAHLSGDPVEGHDFQLWVARGTEAPVSLGVIPAGGSTRVEITEQIRALMSTAAHMAISLEPAGGSPTGQPTGPVLAVGDLRDI